MKYFSLFIILILIGGAVLVASKSREIYPEMIKAFLNKTVQKRDDQKMAALLQYARMKNNDSVRHNYLLSCRLNISTTIINGLIADDMIYQDDNFEYVVDDATGSVKSIEEFIGESARKYKITKKEVAEILLDQEVDRDYERLNDLLNDRERPRE
jgi:hypothetical protein